MAFDNQGRRKYLKEAKFLKISFITSEFSFAKLLLHFNSFNSSAERNPCLEDLLDVAGVRLNSMRYINEKV